MKKVKNDNLELMTVDQIDFKKLSELELERLALGVDFYVATFALVELGERDAKLTSKCAIKIVSDSFADDYLKASALSVLYRVNKPKAKEYIKGHINNASPYLKQKMTELDKYD